MYESVAWFVDGAYVFKAWSSVAAGAKLDYLKLRKRLQQAHCSPTQKIDEAYYFNADPDPPTAAQNGFHNFLAFQPPTGPGLRVKLYWLTRKSLYWPPVMGGGQVVHPTSGTPFQLTQQKGVDVGLAFHVMKSFYRKRWKKLILGAGDGDFHEVVQHLVENENVDVVGLGTEATISSELRPYLASLFALDAEVANVQQ